MRGASGAGRLGAARSLGGGGRTPLRASPPRGAPALRSRGSLAAPRGHRSDAVVSTPSLWPPPPAAGKECFVTGTPAPRAPPSRHFRNARWRHSLSHASGWLPQRPGEVVADGLLTRSSRWRTARRCREPCRTSATRSARRRGSWPGTKCPRDSHAIFEPGAGPARPRRAAREPGALPGPRARPDPLRPDARLAVHLLPGRRPGHGVGPVHQPRSGLNAQICGDAHLSNFGVFGSPERQLVFDCNDFDETLPGPWEWDVKRLAASVVVAARNLGFSKSHRGWRRSSASASATARSCARWRRCRTSTSGTPRSRSRRSSMRSSSSAARPGSKAEAHMAAQRRRR